MKKLFLCAAAMCLAMSLCAPVHAGDSHTPPAPTCDPLTQICTTGAPASPATEDTDTDDSAIVEITEIIGSTITGILDLLLP